MTTQTLLDRKIYNYSGYEIETIFNKSYLDFSFVVKNKDNKIVMTSNRPYDSSDDAYIRACIRINEELK